MSADCIGNEARTARRCSGTAGKKPAKDKDAKDKKKKAKKTKVVEFKRLLGAERNLTRTCMNILHLGAKLGASKLLAG